MSLFLATASMGMQAYGQYQQYKAQQRAAQYNRQVALQQAKLEKRKYETELYKNKRQRDLLFKRQLAAVAKSGLRLSGSPLEVIIDSMTQMALDTSTITYNYKLAKLRALSKASYYSGLSGYFSQAKYLAPTTTLLEFGATKAYGTYSKRKV